jgi:DNA-binding GntR family transcriptional regulator
MALAAESEAATAQQLARRTGIGHSLVRDVLVRLRDAGVVTELPRAYTRAPLYYQVEKGELWTSLRQLADVITNLTGPGVEKAADNRPSRHGPAHEQRDQPVR